MTKKQTTQSANMLFNNNPYNPLFFTTLNGDILLVSYSALNTLTNYELLSHFMHTNNYQGLVIFNIPKNTDSKDWLNNFFKEHKKTKIEYAENYRRI